MYFFKIIHLYYITKLTMLYCITLWQFIFISYLLCNLLLPFTICRSTTDSILTSHGAFNLSFRCFHFYLTLIILYGIFKQHVECLCMCVYDKFIKAESLFDETCKCSYFLYKCYKTFKYIIAVYTHML